MNYKKQFLVILLIAITANCFSQFIYMKTAEIGKIKDATIAIAISNDDELNKNLETFMASNWTASKYKIMKRSELENYVKTTPKNYVITYLQDQKGKLTSSNKALATGGEKDQITYREDHLLLLEGVSKPSKIKTTEALFKSWIDFELEGIDKLAESIRELQQINAILTFADLKDNQLGIFKQMSHYPTNDEKKIISKELWVASSNVEIDEAKVKKIYPYKYKVVSKEQIAEAIKSKTKDIVYLAYVKVQSFENTGIGSPKRPDQTFYVIQDAENGQILSILNGLATFDYRYFEAIKNAAEKAK
ncbi:MAG: hypothetical protein Q7W13_11615 [Bacteroidia bacterium]|nr:hypothetical protein [Bacteroidia bacterium]